MFLNKNASLLTSISLSFVSIPAFLSSLFSFSRAVFFKSGCKDKQLYIAAKYFLKVLLRCRVKHSAHNGFSEIKFFE